MVHRLRSAAGRRQIHLSRRTPARPHRPARRRPSSWSARAARPADCGVADRRDIDIDARAGLNERRKSAGHHYRRGVVHGDRRGSTVTPMRASMLVRLCAENRSAGDRRYRPDRPPGHNRPVGCRGRLRSKPVPSGARRHGPRAGRRKQRRDKQETNLIVDSERKQPQNQAVQKIRPPNSIAHNALAVQQNIHLRKTAGLHRVIARQIGWAYDAAHRNGLRFRINLDVFGPFQHQIAVGQDLRNARAHSGGQRRGARGCAVAFQSSGVGSY